MAEISTVKAYPARRGFLETFGLSCYRKAAGWGTHRTLVVAGSYFAVPFVAAVGNVAMGERSLHLQILVGNFVAVR